MEGWVHESTRVASFDMVQSFMQQMVDKNTMKIMVLKLQHLFLRI